MKFVRAICAAANDEEPNDRENAVRDTFAAADDAKLTGWPKLKEYLGERGTAIVGAVTKWLNVPKSPRPSWAAAGEGMKSHPSHRSLTRPRRPLFPSQPIAFLPRGMRSCVRAPCPFGAMSP